MYQWTCGTNNAIKALVGMSPYLETKKKEAELALDFAVLFHATKSGHGCKGLPMETVAQRDAYYWAISEAKHG